MPIDPGSIGGYLPHACQSAKVTWRTGNEERKATLVLERARRRFNVVRCFPEGQYDYPAGSVPPATGTVAILNIEDVRPCAFDPATNNYRHLSEDEAETLGAPNAWHADTGDTEAPLVRILRARGEIIDASGSTHVLQLAESAAKELGRLSLLGSYVTLERTGDTLVVPTELLNELIHRVVTGRVGDEALRELTQRYVQPSLRVPVELESLAEVPQAAELKQWDGTAIQDEVATQLVTSPAGAALLAATIQRAIESRHAPAVPKGYVPPTDRDPPRLVCKGLCRSCETQTPDCPIVRAACGCYYHQKCAAELLDATTGPRICPDCKQHLWFCHVDGGIPSFNAGEIVHVAHRTGRLDQLRTLLLEECAGTGSRISEVMDAAAHEMAQDPVIATMLTRTGPGDLSTFAPYIVGLVNSGWHRARPHLRAVIARLFPNTPAGSPAMSSQQLSIHLWALEVTFVRAMDLNPGATPLPEGVATSVYPVQPVCCDKHDAAHAEVILLECGHTVHRSCMAGNSASSTSSRSTVGPRWNSECTTCAEVAWPVPFSPDVPIHRAARQRKELHRVRQVLSQAVPLHHGAGILVADLAEQAAVGLANDQLAPWLAQFEPKSDVVQIPHGFTLRLVQAAMLAPPGRLDGMRTLVHHFVLPHTRGRVAVKPDELIDVINRQLGDPFVALLDIITQRAHTLTEQPAVPEGIPASACGPLSCGAAVRCGGGKGSVVQGVLCGHLYHVECAKQLIASRDPEKELQCVDASCRKALWFRNPTSTPAPSVQQRTPTASPDARSQLRTPGPRPQVECDCGKTAAVAARLQKPQGRHPYRCAKSKASREWAASQGTVPATPLGKRDRGAAARKDSSATVDDTSAAASPDARHTSRRPPALPPDPGDSDDDDSTDNAPARPGVTVPLTLNVEQMAITYNDILSWAPLRTLDYIPPGALVAATDVVSRILKDCRAPQSSTRYRNAMVLFYAFPKLVLGALPPDRTESTKAAVMRRLHLIVHDEGRVQLRDEANKAVERIRGLLGDPAARVPTDVPELSETRFDRAGMLTCTDDPEAPADAPPQVTKTQLTRADNHLTLGNFSRGIGALNHTVSAPATEANIEAMRKLHPPGGLPSAETCSGPTPLVDIELTKGQANRILHSFPRGTSGGMSGWTPELLLPLCRVGLGDIADNVAAHMCDIAKGNVRGEHKLFIFSSKAIAQYKKTPTENEDPSIRPLGGGEMTRRAAGKHVIKLSETQASAYLIAKGQVAVGTKGGGEALIHACRATVTAFRTNPAYKDRVYLQADRRNAFNLVSRDKFLQVCKKHAPEAYPYALAAYGDKTYVRYADVAIDSETGSQQGCPLGMLLFCLAAADADDQICKTLLEALDLKGDFADDQQMAGTLEAVATFHEEQKRVAVDYGFEYNLAKYRVSCHPDYKAEVLARLGLDESNWIPFEELEVLGTPIGSDEAVEKAMEKLVEKARKKLKKFTLLPNKHRAAAALHFGATSLMTHFMRTCRVPQPLIQDLDDTLLETAAAIHEVPLDEKHKTRLAMGYKEGGGGYRVSAPYTDIAYVASVSETISLAQKLTKIDLGLLPTKDAAKSAVAAAGTNVELAEDIKARSSSSTSSDTRGLQRLWSKALDEVNKETRLAAAGITQDRVQRARIASVAGSRHASHPIPNPNGILPAAECWHDNVTFTMTSKWRMGDPIYNEHGTCGFCGCLVRDPLGEHVSTCMSKGKRSRLHSAISKVIFDAASLGGCHPVREDQCFSQTKPGARLDVVCYNLANEKGIPAIDVAITANYSHVPATNDVDLPGFIATRYEDKKWTHYGGSVTNCPVRLGITHTPGDSPIALIPFVMDAYGALGDSAKKFLPRLARAIATRLHARPQMILEALLLKLQLTVQRHIADMFRAADTSPRTVA